METRIELFENTMMGMTRKRVFYNLKRGKGLSEFHCVMGTIVKVVRLLLNSGKGRTLLTVDAKKIFNSANLVRNRDLLQDEWWIQIAYHHSWVCHKAQCC